MKDIKFKIFASAHASVLLVGCNDLDTEPLGAVVTTRKKKLLKTTQKWYRQV